MSSTIAVLLPTLLFLSGAATAALAVVAFRRRAMSAVRPLVGFLLSISLWSIGYGFGILTTDPAMRQAWGFVQWFAIPYFPVFWFLFAVEYTGNERYLNPRRVGALFVLPVFTTLMALTNGWFGLMWSEYTINYAAGLALVTYEFEPWFVLHMLYTYSLLLAGMILLFRLIVADRGLYTDQVVWLVVGMAVPWIANFLVILRMVPVVGFDYTPFAWAITGVAFSNALFRHRLLQFLPAIRTVGRDEALDNLESGILILDTDRSIVFINPAAATLFDCAPETVTGEPVGELIDEGAIDFDSPDGLGEITVRGRQLEVRSSRITNRHGEEIGDTIVLNDITERTRQRQALEQQRDELSRLEDLNTTIRGVHSVLIPATTADEITDAACNRLADSELYTAAVAADMSTWRGHAHDWTTAGETKNRRLPGQQALAHDEQLISSDRAANEDDISGWIVVPIVHERTVHGMLGVYTDRTNVTESEFDILSELGELIGHGITAVEHRALLTTEPTLEMNFESGPGDSALAAVSQRAGCSLDLVGFVPAAETDAVAYIRADGASTEEVMAATSEAEIGDVRPIRSGRDRGLLEWTVPDRTLLGAFDRNSDQLHSAMAADGAAHYQVSITPDQRTEFEGWIGSAFPDASLVSETTHEQPTDSAAELPGVFETLTDRQREVVEAAHRAGYFEWPREATAEEVAESQDIAPSTLHGHLRKAQAQIVEALFCGEQR